MNRRGPQKHSNETIRSAIARLESGARLSTIARELNVPKNTVKYWLDHANKYLADEKNQNLVGVRIKSRLTREVWDIIFVVLKTLKGKLDQTSARDLILIVGELFDRQAQFGAFANGKVAMPGKVLEASEEVKVTVERYLQKQSATFGPSEKKGKSGSVIDVSLPEESLAAPTPERSSSSEKARNTAGAGSDRSEENESND